MEVAERLSGRLYVRIVHASHRLPLQIGVDPDLLLARRLLVRVVGRVGVGTAFWGARRRLRSEATGCVARSAGMQSRTRVEGNARPRRCTTETVQIEDGWAQKSPNSARRQKMVGRNVSSLLLSRRPATR